MKKAMLPLCAALMIAAMLAGCGNYRSTTLNELEDVVKEANTLPADASGMVVGKWVINNIHAGDTIETTVIIKNGDSAEKTYLVYYRPPDNPTSGFAKPKAEYADWVDVAYPSVTMAPHSFATVPVIITIPSDPNQLKGMPDQWEFWIGMRAAEGVMIQSEMNTRYLVVSAPFDWTPVWITLVGILVLSLIAVIVYERHIKKQEVIEETEE